MAYCAYCGKQIPEGTLCDCADAQTIALAVQQAMKAQQPPAPAPKKKAHLFIPLTALLLLTIIGAGVGGYLIYPALNGTAESSSRTSKSKSTYTADADDVTDTDTDPSPAPERNVPAAQTDNADTQTAAAVSSQTGKTYSLSDFVPADEYEEQFAEYYASSYAADGAETYYSYIYPAELIDELRSDGSLSELVTERNESTSKLIGSGSTAKIVCVTASEELTSDELEAVENHFADLCSEHGLKSCKFSVTDGAQLEAEYYYNYGNGSTATRTASVCVVYIEGDGWMVVPIPVSAM